MHEDANVRFERIAKRYDATVAVAELDLEIAAGTFVALLGPSGCGKTTTLRLIAGQTQPSDGRIHIGGEDVTGLPYPERDVQIVTQQISLFKELTVLQNASYGRVVRHQARAIGPEDARRALAHVGLAGLEERLPGSLSGGQAQRVAIARALVSDPAVMLFDEPLSSLDAPLRRQLRADIRDLQRRLGFTVVYVTHDHAEAMSVADRVVVMRDGRVVQDGTPEEIYTRPVDGFVAAFVGEANRLPARIEAVDGALARVALGPIVLELPRRGLEPGPAALAIRAEALALASPGPNGRALPGRIAKATYVGAAMEYRVQTELGELFAVAPAAARRFAEGEAVELSVAPGGGVLLPGGL